MDSPKQLPLQFLPVDIFTSSLQLYGASPAALGLQSLVPLHCHRGQCQLGTRGEAGTGVQVQSSSHTLSCGEGMQP